MQIYAYPNRAKENRSQFKLKFDELFVNVPAAEDGSFAQLRSGDSTFLWLRRGCCQSRTCGALELTEGGRQNNRGSGMHEQHRYVENIFEELDAVGEWFYDRTSNMLSFFPPEGLDLANATVEFPTSSQLIRMNGTQKQPVKNVTLRGLTLRHANRTFMQTKEPLLRSNWTIDREGCVPRRKF